MVSKKDLAPGWRPRSLVWSQSVGWRGAIAYPWKLAIILRRGEKKGGEKRKGKRETGRTLRGLLAPWGLMLADEEPRRGKGKKRQRGVRHYPCDDRLTERKKKRKEKKDVSPLKASYHHLVKRKGHPLYFSTFPQCKEVTVFLWGSPSAPPEKEQEKEREEHVVLQPFRTLLLSTSGAC